MIALPLHRNSKKSFQTEPVFFSCVQILSPVGGRVLSKNFIMSWKNFSVLILVELSLCSIIKDHYPEGLGKGGNFLLALVSWQRKKAGNRGCSHHCSSSHCPCTSLCNSHTTVWPCTDETWVGVSRRKNEGLGGTGGIPIIWMTAKAQAGTGRYWRWIAVQMRLRGELGFPWPWDGLPWSRTAGKNWSLSDKG